MVKARERGKIRIMVMVCLEFRLGSVLGLSYELELGLAIGLW